MGFLGTDLNYAPLVAFYFFDQQNPCCFLIKQQVDFAEKAEK